MKGWKINTRHFEQWCGSVQCSVPHTVLLRWEKSLVIKRCRFIFPFWIHSSHKRVGCLWLPMVHAFIYSVLPDHAFFVSCSVSALLSHELMWLRVKPGIRRRWHWIQVHKRFQSDNTPSTLSALHLLTSYMWDVTVLYASLPSKLVRGPSLVAASQNSDARVYSSDCRA